MAVLRTSRRQAIYLAVRRLYHAIEQWAADQLVRGQLGFNGSADASDSDEVGSKSTFATAQAY